MTNDSKSQPHSTATRWSGRTAVSAGAAVAAVVLAVVLMSGGVSAHTPADVAAVAAENSGDAQWPAFARYIEAFGKSYPGAAAELRTRFANYKTTASRLLEFRAAHPFAQFGETSMSDLSSAEFARRLMPVPANRNRKVKRFVPSAATTPWWDQPAVNGKNVVNWCPKDGDNFCTAVKDQNPCGTCWAFVTAEVAESSALQRNLLTKKQNLSSQQFVDCEKKVCNNHYPEKSGVSSMIDPISDARNKFCGFNLETDYPTVIESKNDPYLTPKPCAMQSDKFVLGASDVVTWKSGSDCEKKMRDYVATTGTVGTSIYASDAWGSYTGGIMGASDSQGGAGEEFITCPDDGGHAVQIVGYGDRNGNIRPYWVMRNSWGADWGEKGYFRVQMGDSCTEPCFGDAATLVADSPHKCANIKGTSCGFCHTSNDDSTSYITPDGETKCHDDASHSGGVWTKDANRCTCPTASTGGCKAIGHNDDICGWCLSGSASPRSQFHQPNKQLPAFPSSDCLARDFVTDSGECDEYQKCYSQTCDSIKSNSKCGWCQTSVDEGYTTYASSNGGKPDNLDVPCNGASMWFHGSGRQGSGECGCPSAVTKCNNIEGRSNCGWCKTTGQQGKAMWADPTTKQPAFGQICSDNKALFIYDNEKCPDSTDEVCEALTSCSDIKSNSKCGWCQTGRLASNGYAAKNNNAKTGPDRPEFSCAKDFWFTGSGRHGSDECDCLSVQNCYSIRGRSNCGWCIPSGSAAFAMWTDDNSKSPAFGTCPGRFIWDSKDCPDAPEPNGNAKPNKPKPKAEL